MAGVDARAAPHLNGAAIRERQVHVKNLRHFSSAVCISEEPTVDSDESTIWKFFQNLAEKVLKSREIGIRIYM